MRNGWKLVIVTLLVAAGTSACSEEKGDADIGMDVEIDSGQDTEGDSGSDPAADPDADVDEGIDEDADADGDVEGEIVYTDEDPDIVIDEWEMYTLKLHGPPGPYGEMQTYYIWFHPFSPAEVVLNTFDTDAQVLAGGGGLPLALEEGAPIEAGSTSWVTAGEYLVLNRGGTGNWVGVTDRYLGLRFRLDGTWRYGWARLDIDAAPTRFVVKDYAYQSVMEIGIAAGEGRP